MTASRPTTGGATLAFGTHAARPASGTTQGFYYSTDYRRGTLFGWSGSAWLSCSKALDVELGWFNVLDFGMDPTGVSNNSTILTSIIALLDPLRAGTIWFPQGKYLLSGTMASPGGAIFQGEGQPGIGSLDQASTQWIVPTATWGLTLGSSTSTLWRGFGVRSIGFRDNVGTALGGLRILRANNCDIMDVSFTDFPAGTPMLVDGTGDNTQYCNINRCRFGLGAVHSYHQKAANGTAMTQCYFEGNNGTPPPNDGRIARYLESGDTFRSWGDRLQGFATLDHVGANLEHRITDVRYENWRTAAVRVVSGAARCSISGAGDNSQGSNLGSGALIDSGALDTDLSGLYMENVITQISDSGTRTIYPRAAFVTKAGAIGDGDYALTPQNGSMGVDTTNNHLQIKVSGTWRYINSTGGISSVISRVGKVAADSGGSTGNANMTMTTTAAVPAGNYVIVGFVYGLGTSPTVTITDTRSNTYTVDSVANKTTGDGPHCGVASCKVSTPLQVGDTITLTYSASVNYPSASAWQYANLASSSVLDQQAGTTGTSTSPSSGNITTTVAQTALVGVICGVNGATFTAGTGFDNPTYGFLDNLNIKQLHMEDQVKFSTGTYAATGTLSPSSDWAACVAAYKSS